MKRINILIKVIKVAHEEKTSLTYWMQVGTSELIKLESGERTNLSSGKFIRISINPCYDLTYNNTEWENISLKTTKLGVKYKQISYQSTRMAKTEDKQQKSGSALKWVEESKRLGQVSLHRTR